MEEYCSEIQRTVYLLAEGEHAASLEVQRGFETVRRTVEAAVVAMRPGVPGWDVDAAARSVITGAGYPEYKYGTGHALGRNAHDGGGLVTEPGAEYLGDPQRELILR